MVKGKFRIEVWYCPAKRKRASAHSVWSAVLMHAAGNTFANTLLNGFASEGFVSLAPKTIWLTSFGVEGVLIIAIFAIYAVVLYRQRN